MVDTLPSGVQIQEQWSAVFYTKAADVPAMSNGLARTFDGITIHYWGDTTDFMVVVNTFCDGNKQTSAHYIVEADQVACVVSPWDVAWACGNWEGNRTTISIECNPRGSDEDYTRIAEVIKYLRDRYGDLPLIPHNHWTATSCPGSYDLGRLDQLARGTTVINTNPAPALPNTGDTDVALSSQDIDAIFQKRFTRQGVQPGAYADPTLCLQDVIEWFDAAHNADRDTTNALKAYIDEKFAALPAGNVTVPPIDANTVDTIAGRVADIFLQRGYILTQRTQA